MRSAEDLIEQPGVDAVRDELDRLLGSPYFNQSRRLPNFLRFVVEHALAGDIERIKERTLGIEIFGKDADYDTSTDPIVRVTAAEIRKRVAQYYQDPAHSQELRITLPSGSYVPHFSWPSAEPAHWPPDPKDRTESAPSLSAARKTPKFPGRLLPSILIGAGTILAAMTAVFVYQHTQRSSFDSFWQPVLSHQEPVLLCIADQLEYSEIELRDAADPSHQMILKDNLTAIVIDDLNPVVRVGGILQSQGKKYDLKGEAATNLDDLRNGPTVFIGAFDNAWTLRLTHPLRYRFGNDAGMTHLWIEDSEAPEKVRWVLDRNIQMATNNYRDYAIVARFTDNTTGQLAIVIAGIGRGGTRVAGEFLTRESDLVQLMGAATKAGNKKNMEAVLSTQIIDGEPGTPKIEAFYSW